MILLTFSKKFDKKFGYEAQKPYPPTVLPPGNTATQQNHDKQLKKIDTAATRQKKSKTRSKKIFQLSKKFFPAGAITKLSSRTPATNRVTLRLWSSPGLACKAGGAPDLSGPTFIQLHDSSDRL